MLASWQPVVVGGMLVIGGSIVRRTPWTLLPAALLAALVALALSGTLAGAQEDDTGWLIEAFDAELAVRADGSVEVSEQIAVDFAGLERHGIFRVIPVRYAIAADDPRVRLPPGRDPADFRRALEIDGIEVTSTAPDQVETSLEGDSLVIRVGDPDVTVTGAQTYRLRYLVRGAFNRVPTGAQLAWDVTGLDWPVPIRAATVTVEAPELLRAGCVQGPAGANTPCVRDRVDAAHARFSAGPLAPGSGMTVTVSFPAGAVEVPPPLLVEPWRASRALAGSPAALPLTALTALLGFGGVALLARRGRDPGASAGDGGGGAAGIGGPGQRFDPPQGLRPAQLSVILDQRVGTRDLSATLLDLAARGWLEIEQLPPVDKAEPDWRLRRAGSGHDTDLLDYERRLLGALFAGGDEVTLSDLRGGFTEEYGRFRDRVYADAVARGWSPRNPASVRARWLGIGIAAVLVSGAVLGLALAFSTVAAAALPLLGAALALLVAHRWMPRRSEAGARLLTEARDFRRFLNDSAGLLQPGDGDPAALFARCLPYAVAVGAVPQLAAAFADLTDPREGRVAPWYYHHPGAYPGWYSDPRAFATDLSSFAEQVGSGLSTAPSSGSGGDGGSSGGGAGGGGGGSW